MPATGRGIIYPESDAHTRLWEHLQSLAQTADTAIANAIAAAAPVDTGNVSVPYASGWKSSGTALQVRKIGKLCHLSGTVTNTGNSIPIIGSGGADVATLPAGFIPTTRELFPIAPQNPGTAHARGYIQTTGVLRIYTYGASTPYVDFVATYFID